MWMLLWTCTALALAPPQAQDPGLLAALGRYSGLQYEAAIPLLERALARPDLTEADRRIALAYLGRAHAVLHHQAAAVEAFTLLLEREPEHAIPAIESPLIREAFEQAQARVAAARTTQARVATAPGGDVLPATAEATVVAPTPPPEAPAKVAPDTVDVTDSSSAAVASPPADPPLTTSPRPAAVDDTALPTTAQLVPAEPPAEDDRSGLLIASAAVAAGGVLLGAGALAVWLLWPAPAPSTNLGSWELP